MNPLQVNPSTGFLESINPNAIDNFTSDRKLKFLSTAEEFAKKREYPDISSLCDSVGIKYRTFMKHLENDEVFREEWSEIKARLASGFTSELAVKAKSKMGIIANLAVLRYLESGKWNNDNNITIKTDDAGVKALFDRSNKVVEAEIVPNPVNVSTQAQLNEPQ